MAEKRAKKSKALERGAVYRRLCSDARQLGIDVLLYMDGGTLTALGLQFADEIKVTSLIGDDDLDRAAERMNEVLADARQG